MSLPVEKISKRNTRLEFGRFSPARVTVAEDQVERDLEPAVQSLQSALGISRVTATIMAARDIVDPAAAKSFLNPTLKSELPDPRQMKNIEAAADLILTSIEAKKRICIFHDFDVDGLTAGSQLVLFLKALGAEARCYVPNRFVEGYGLSIAGVEKVAEAGTDLLITVDCGISNIREIALAKRLGMQTIILDHHEPAELPPADVIVDPAQEGCPFQKYRLAAAGVVWMLLIVLRGKARERSIENIPDPKDFLDLAAIGTICDMVPLTEVNRLIAHRGIESIKGTARLGVQALINVSGLNGKPRFGAGHISFAIGPRINAAGRLDDASQVGELLTTSNSGKAKSLAESIDRLNKRRRSIEEEVRISCIDSLHKEPHLLEAPAIALFQEDFHLGVIGIAAQRLVEEFHKPAAVMALGDAVIDGKEVKVVKGSVRSIKGFNVAEVLHGMSEILIAGGGHAAAGGFSLLPDRLEDFQAAFIEAAEQRLTADMLMRCQRADVRVAFSEVDFLLADELQKLAPFGVGNPSPVLVSEGVTVESATTLSGKHLRLRLSDGKVTRNAVAWGFNGHPLLKRGEQVNIAYQVEINSYQGVSSVQLSLKQAWV